MVYDVALAPGAKRLSFIVHRGDEQCAKVEEYDVAANGGVAALWVVSGQGEVFTQEPDVRLMPTGVVDLKRARAVWLARDVIAVRAGARRVDVVG